MSRQLTQAGVLRSHVFDFSFIIGTLCIALVSGWTVASRPDLFPVVLAFDLWFVGYFHVVSTYTKLLFDTESLYTYRSLITKVPVFVVVVTGTLMYFFGIPAIITIYFYWQWFHYTRQSYGISQAYQRKSQISNTYSSYVLTGVVYSLPIWGILNRSYQNHDTFLSMPFWSLPVPFILVKIAALISISCIVLWVFDIFKNRKQYKNCTYLVAYMISHILIFYVGYILIENLTFGWIAINVWHNIQYILFVWDSNNKRFDNSISTKHVFLSTISQTKHFAYYIATCLVLTLLVYGSLGVIYSHPTFAILPLAVIVAQSINFHHYIVDSIIWKKEKGRMAKFILS